MAKQSTKSSATQTKERGHHTEEHTTAESLISPEDKNSLRQRAENVKKAIHPEHANAKFHEMVEELVSRRGDKRKELEEEAGAVYQEVVGKRWSY